MNGLVETAREALEPIEPWDESRGSRTQHTERTYVLRTDVPNVSTYSVYFLGVGLYI
jgi:hypothetical protein